MPRRRTAILISGRGSNMAALIEAAEAPDFPAEIALVLSSRPDAAGIERALAAGVAAEPLDHAAFAGKAEFESAIAARLEHHGIDLVCLAGFMRLLSDDFVETWRDRLINIHPSLLPAFAGLNTHARALDAGVKIHGCTVHYVRSAMDSGPIVAQAAVPVLTGDTAGLLAARVLAAEHRLYPFALSLVAGGKVRVVGQHVVFEDGFSGDSAGDRLIAPRPPSEPVASS
jgi:phosphoribosylglycinamide formyltransferase 1